MHPQKVDFLFIYEVKARELENVCLLACELERRGYSTAILNSWAMLKKRSRPAYSCTTLVVSACYNEEVYRFFTGFAAHYEKVFCLQWEQVPVNYSYRSRQVTSWTYQGPAKQVRNVCWGEAGQKRLVESFGVAPDCTRVTGYITLDFYRPMFRPMLVSRRRLFEREGLDAGKKTCLFISSFAYVKLPPKLEAVADEGDDKARFGPNAADCAGVDRAAALRGAGAAVYLPPASERGGKPGAPGDGAAHPPLLLHCAAGR